MICIKSCSWKIYLVTGMLITAYLSGQKANVKDFIEQLLTHADNNFENIAGSEIIDSNLRTCKIKPPFGELNISLMSYGSILYWSIPMSARNEVEKELKVIIRSQFSDSQQYLIVPSTDFENSSFTMLNIYRKVGKRKPRLLIQTLFYNGSESKDKSKFIIIIYGKS